LRPWHRSIVGGWLHPLQKQKKAEQEKSERQGKKIHRKKDQKREEGRIFFRESLEENLEEDDPFPDRQLCATLTSPITVGSHFLLRVRSNLKVKVVRRCSDGSRVVRVPVREQGKSNRIVTWLELREIKVKLQRRGFKTTELRLWTTLLDPKRAPAQELVPLYAERWEHELFYREIKRQLRKNALLQAHTVNTAGQEIASLMLAASLLARARDRAAAGEVPVLRVSFIKLLDLLRPLWLVLQLGADILSEKQKQQLSDRFYDKARTYLTPKRRQRSCPRKVRQPVSSWPRLMKNEYLEGPVTFKFS
jgi:hypothetical protein